MLSRLPQPLWATAVAAVSVVVAGTALTVALVVSSGRNDDSNTPSAPAVPGGGSKPTSTQNVLPAASPTPSVVRTNRGTVNKPRYTGKATPSPTPTVSVTASSTPTPSVTKSEVPPTAAPTTPDPGPPVTSAPDNPPPSSPTGVDPTGDAQ